MTRKTLKVAGLDGAFFEEGNGPTLLILASQLIRAPFYQKTIETLCDAFRVVVLELPGSGCSSPLSQPWTCEQYAHWTAAFIRKRGNEKPILLGHSNSGPVALLLSLRYPDLVSQLILADTIGAHPTHSLLHVLFSRAFDSVLEWRLTLSKAHHPLLNFFQHPFNFLNQVWLAAKSDITHEVSLVTIPTHVLWGGRDLTMPKTARQEILKRVPNASLFIDPEGSHDWIVEHAVKLKQALKPLYS